MVPSKYGATHKVPFRRRREAKTNYRYRLKLLKSKQPRAVVRKTLKHTTVQFIKFDFHGDQVIASATSTELKNFGWSGSTANLPTAYLTGLLAGKRALKQNIDSAVLDIGLQPPVKGSKVFASLQGILDAGVDVPHGEEILPTADRLTGKHISDASVTEFEKIKSKIMDEFGSAKPDSKK
ncbi:50S ribosomal protein L18 [[Eubacterium] cellulosolvens]